MCFWPGLALESQDNPVPIFGVPPDHPAWPVPLHAVDVSQEKAQNGKRVYSSFIYQQADLLISL
jgi:hypothetical protein